MPSDELLYDIKGFARVTHTSRSWVRSKIKSGELPHVVLPGGRLIRIPGMALTKLTVSPADTADSDD